MIDLKKLFYQKETENKKEEVKEEVEKTREVQQPTQVETAIQTYKCLRCGHVWVPRKKEKPRVCPKCKSPYWDKPKG